MGRSAELEEFLKRVEDYDLQRKGNNNIVKDSDNAGSNGITGGYSEKSLNIARNLLAKHDVEIIDQESRSFTLEAPELAYRSAYNYEKTFSPSRKVTTSSKTYIVSEDDYFLLQRLKAKEKPPAPLPPREKSKEDDSLKMSLKRVTTNVSPPDAAIPSHLPYTTHHDIQAGESCGAASSSASDMVKNKELSTVPIESIVPNSKKRQEHQPEELKLNGDAEKRKSSSRLPTTKSTQKIELKSSPKKFDLKAELGPRENISTQHNSRLSSSANESLSTSSSSHMDFSDCRRQNKMKLTLEKQKPSPSVEKASPLHFDRFVDSAVQKSSLPPDKPAKPSQLTTLSCSRPSKTETQSYISSVLKYSPPQQSTSCGFHANFTLPSKQGSEGFIDSVLKTSPKLPPSEAMKTRVMTKPFPVTKPVFLKKSSTAPNDNDAVQEKKVQTSKLSLLRSKTADEKASPPKVPPKKSELALPKALRRKQSDLQTDFGAKLKKTIPPEVPKKKPSLPEALTRLGNLSKPPPSPRRHNEIPEALTKVGHLSKAAPPPERHDEIPEALTKVGHLSKTVPSPKRTETVPEALSHLAKLNKTCKEPSSSTRNLSMEEALQGPSRARDVRRQLGTVLMAHNIGPSSTSISSIRRDTSTSTGSCDSNIRHLSHANKTRSRGPKRRMPSNIRIE